MEEKKKANFYFNEEQVTRWIFDYQKSAIIEKNEDGDDVVVWKDKKLEELISQEIIKIVKAIIQVYKYYNFEPYDDCLQHGMMNCYTNYMKWKPEKGTAFNFFSIISKRSILNYTERKQKHRNHKDIDEMLDIHYNEFDFDTFIEDMNQKLNSIINENYTNQKRKNFLKISVILSDYLMKTKKFVSKTDFYSWARSYGMRSMDIREFVKEMSIHGCEIYESLKIK